MCCKCQFAYFEIPVIINLQMKCTSVSGILYRCIIGGLLRIRIATLFSKGWFIACHNNSSELLMHQLYQTSEGAPLGNMWQLHVNSISF